eukprot:s624_g32.t1
MSRYEQPQDISGERERGLIRQSSSKTPSRAGKRSSVKPADRRGRTEVTRAAGSLFGGRTCPSDRCYWKSARGQLPGSSRPCMLQDHDVNAEVDEQLPAASPSDNNDLHRRAAGLIQNVSEAPGLSKEFDTEVAFPLGEGDDVSKISFSFATWCMSVTRWVLQSRTGFARFLSCTLSLQRDGPQAPPTALLPLPMPCVQPYAVGPDQSEGVSRQKAINRGLHVIISAVNYLYWARSSPNLDLIRRQPNAIQQQAIDRLRLLLWASDHSESIQVAMSGRRNLQLTTRLQELARAADALGLSASPYQEGPPGVSVPVDNTGGPQLSPFSNLNPERLKITGRGQWRASDYLTPELYMAYQEPQVVELAAPVFNRGLPNFGVDEPQTVQRLFKKWDDLGLLSIHPIEHITTGESGRVKIFNAFKNTEVDRQIGDRRERNGWEARVPGPSALLPVGPLIGRLFIPQGYGVKVCITDRSDYYHQLAVSPERSRTNVVWPAMPLRNFLEFEAYQTYLKTAAQKKCRIDRTVFGDHLHGHRPRDFPVDPDALVYGGFNAVLQGDHLGVEFGIAAHVGFLQEHGLLGESGRLTMDRLVRKADVYEGLVIDDYFCLAPVPIAELQGASSSKPSAARRAFDKAKQAYANAGLAGSDPKDVVDQHVATVVGAQVDSRVELTQSGMLPVGAPAAKRLSLSWIAAKASSFGFTTDALHASLLGGLTSAFCFRRCSMSILGALYKVIPHAELDTEHPQLRKLPRKAAEELILSSVLLPVLVSDIKSPLHEWIYASDASNSKGAFCEAKVSEQVQLPLWLAGDFKGSRVTLDPWPRQYLKESGWFDIEEELKDDGTLPSSEDPTGSFEPQRPLAQFFDFLEICGGSGVISEELAQMGFTVGPIIDITYSQQYDMTKLRVIEWALFLVQNHRVKALALEPPCTTFSAAAYPPCRSYKTPRGFNQKLSKVWVGNRLAFACLLLLFAAAYEEVIALLETPRRSKMAWLQEWIRLLELPNIEEVYTASCSFGSPFQKEFRFLVCNMRAGSICKPCTRDHSHVRIQGQLTKGSAVYCPGLARALAVLFAKHIRAKDAFEERQHVKFAGLESPTFMRALDQEGLFRLAELPKMRRWASNWTCLVLGLCTLHSLRMSTLAIDNPRFRSSLPPVDFFHFLLDFDSTLGFPGEGPPTRLISWTWNPISLATLFLVLGLSHGMLPRHRADEQRAAGRQVRPLVAGRPVQPATRTNREQLLEKFEKWLELKGCSLTCLLDHAYAQPERLVEHLVEYGKQLYAAGRPYNHFAETINAIGAIKPTIRRMLTGAWDLAFSWVREEPGQHHTACPYQILLALLSTSILWGWPLVAGAIALSWGAVCRIGEVLHAYRRDLVTPADVCNSHNSTFLKVQEPKTRYKAARHQMCRMDYADLVDLVACAFGRLRPDEKLWPHSAQLLRTRFKQLLAALGLANQGHLSERMLDLGSLRAGGATHLMMLTEDAELVRRRGRWLAYRTMEIYLQEINATVFFPRLPPNVKARVLNLAAAFPALLIQMRMFSQGQVPAATWYFLFQSGADGNDGKNPGLQDAREIENWLLIYPEMDEPVLDIWINSLRTTAQTGFKMTLGEPIRLMCSDHRLEVPELLQRHVTLGAKKKTEGMNAKSWGPLWHILPEEKETPVFEHFYRHPVMMLGINIYQTSSGHRWMGLVASLNKPCSQFYSGAKDSGTMDRSGCRVDGPREESK